MVSDGSSSSSELSETLQYTPTWVVAAVCAVIVAISLFAARFLHYLGKFLQKSKQDALYEALQKLKEELMLLGFISLMLTVFQNLISQICVPGSFYLHVLPCKWKGGLASENETQHVKGYSLGLTHTRRMLLSESGGSDPCRSRGRFPLLSVEALHQLHIFIFVLALVHVVFCASTMVLGGAKIRKWKHWEETIHKEISEQEKSSTDEHSLHIHPHHEFLKERTMGFSRNSLVVRWMKSFFKQFYASVTKSDYAGLRSGFIMRHCSSNKNFDFYKYMMRALQEDFKIIVGITWYLWLFVVMFLLLNVHGWHAYFWLSFLPLILLLIVGSKLEYIITRLAQEAAEKPADNDPGIPRVKPSDHHFWFHHPGAVLYLIHFILFQNSFEIAFLFWIWSTYGFDTCIMEKMGYMIPRLVMGVMVQVLCSYSTLPLYAIVTQMGDMFKHAIFDDQLRSMLHGWAENARRRKRSGTGVPSFLKGLRPFGSKTNGDQMQQMASEASETSQNAQRPTAFDGVLASMVNPLETRAADS